MVAFYSIFHNVFSHTILSIFLQRRELSICQMRVVKKSPYYSRIFPNSFKNLLKRYKS